jgi:hypothetical protein
MSRFLSVVLLRMALLYRISQQCASWLLCLPGTDPTDETHLAAQV